MSGTGCNPFLMSRDNMPLIDISPEETSSKARILASTSPNRRSVKVAAIIPAPHASHVRRIATCRAEDSTVSLTSALGPHGRSSSDAWLDRVRVSFLLVPVSPSRNERKYFEPNVCALGFIKGDSRPLGFIPLLPLLSRLPVIGSRGDAAVHRAGWSHRGWF